MCEHGAKFERAWVTTQYVMGARGADLLDGLASASPEARDLARRLGAEDRSARARALAPDLGRIVQALTALELA